MRALIIILLLLSNVAFTIQAQVFNVTETGVHEEFVNPDSSTCYRIEKLTDSISYIKWTVTDGSFNELIEEKSIGGPDRDYACAYWGNPKVEGSTPPKGTITVEVTYTENGSNKTEKKTINQKIRSYNGATPPNLIKKGGGTTIPLGGESFEVELSSTFYLPYKDENNSLIDVRNFEWIMPKSWYGNDTIINNGGSSITVIPDYFSDGTIKVRGVNPRYEKDKTAFSSITIKRAFAYSAYPATIRYGISETYTYTVPAVSGATYEWSMPSGWTIVSGANTHSIRVTKSPCATSADVKVRLKSGSEYSGWFTAPNTKVLPPNITIPSAIEQYRDISISVDIPSDKIQSFTVAGSGVSIVSGQGANTLVCQFENDGSQEITISLKLKECGSSYELKKEVNVSKIQLSISGSDAICEYTSSSETYSIPSLPSGATVSWSCTGGATLSGSSTGASCFVRGTTAGYAQVLATVLIKGKTTNLTKNIEVASTDGNPYLSYTSDDRYIYLTIHTPNIYGIRQFIWYASGSSSHGSSTGPAGNYWTLPKGSYTVECQVVTQCVRMTATTTIGGARSSVYPNPVDQTLFVDIAELEETDGVDGVARAPKAASDSYELRLFNFQGALVRNLRVTNRQVSIDVSGLPGGNYFLHILRDGATTPEVHKVIIKH